MGDERASRTGEITCDEAREIARRYNASHFDLRGLDHEHARYSIPANPHRDDDIRLAAFIDQAERNRAALAAKDEEIAALRAERDEARVAHDMAEREASRLHTKVGEYQREAVRLRARDEQTARVIEEVREALNERAEELAYRLVAPGPFPQMSASEGHELSDAVLSAIGALAGATDAAEDKHEGGGAV